MRSLSRLWRFFFLLNSFRQWDGFDWKRDVSTLNASRPAAVSVLNTLGVQQTVLCTLYAAQVHTANTHIWIWYTLRQAIVRILLPYVICCLIDICLVRCTIVRTIFHFIRNTKHFVWFFMFFLVYRNLRCISNAAKPAGYEFRCHPIFFPETHSFGRKYFSLAAATGNLLFRFGWIIMT